MNYVFTNLRFWICAGVLALSCIPGLAANTTYVNIWVRNVGPVAIRARAGGTAGGDIGLSSWLNHAPGSSYLKVKTFYVYSYVSGSQAYVDHSTNATSVVHNTLYQAAPYQGALSGSDPNTTLDLYFDITGNLTTPDTYYTNTFTWKNNSLIPLSIVANGNHPMFPQMFTANGNQTYNWTFVTTNIAGWMTLDEFDGPFHQDLTPSTVTSNNYQLDKITAPGTNILFSGGATPASDETLQEGFNTLYSAINEASEANTKALQAVNLSVTNVNNNNVTNINNNTNVLNVSVTNIGDNAALNYISNVLAQSGDNGTNYKAEATWTSTAEDIRTKADSDTSTLRTKVIEKGGLINFTSPGESGPPAELTLDIDTHFIQMNLNLDPMNTPFIASVFTWLKWVIAWMASAYALVWAIRLVLDKTHNLFNVPQLGTKGFWSKVGGLGGLGWLSTFGMLTVYVGGFGLIFFVISGWLDKIGADFTGALGRLASPALTGTAVPGVILYLLGCIIPFDHLFWLGQTCLVFWLYVEAASIGLAFTIKLMSK